MFDRIPIDVRQLFDRFPIDFRYTFDGPSKDFTIDVRLMLKGGKVDGDQKKRVIAPTSMLPVVSFAPTSIDVS